MVCYGGFVGKRGGGLERYWGLGKWAQLSPSVEGARCDCLRRTEEKRGNSFTCISFSRSHCSTVVPGVLACKHVYMLWIGWKTASDRCFICRCRQVHTCRPALLTLNYILACDHTHHRAYICSRVCTFCLFVLSNVCTTCVCITGVLNTCMRV